MSDQTLSEQPTSEDSISIPEAIAELEAYRQRIFDSHFEQAKKLKLKKQDVVARLEANPEVVKINEMIEDLQKKQAAAS